MVMSPSINSGEPPVRVPESGGSPLVGIRGLEAGVAGVSDDGERGGRVGETAGWGARDLVLEKVALPVMLSMTMP
jgi:hypothetical protein